MSNQDYTIEVLPPSDNLSITLSDERQRWEQFVQGLQTWAIPVVMNSVRSPRSKRAYGESLTAFFLWWAAGEPEPLSKELVNAYRQHLLDRGLAPASVNLALSAVRKMVNEAADNGRLDQETAGRVLKAKGVSIEGVRAGNWLTFQQAAALVNAPDVATLKGKRDRAILYLMVTCGLRREECANLTTDHIQMRDGRWVIVDMIGKRGKVRTIPLPDETKTAIDEWLAAAGIESGSLWRNFRKGDRMDSTGMSTQAIWCVVKHYAAKLGLDNIAPHDLRRTAAKLWRKMGVPLEEISTRLGHSSIETTQRYLGTDPDWRPEYDITFGIALAQERIPGV